MKTGMEYPLIGLALLLAGMLLWNAWSDMQVEIAVAAVNATIAGEAAPAPVLLAGELVTKAVVGAGISGAVTALATALIVWARREWTKAHAEQPATWKGGPNAQWGRSPKMPSEAELYRLMLMQQIASTGSTTGSGYRRPLIFSPPGKEDDDEPTIEF